MIINYCTLYYSHNISKLITTTLNKKQVYAAAAGALLHAAAIVS
jgi:hypothetical protein